MENRHGGDVYRNRVELDFSVNINPLGAPEGVKEALRAAMEDVTRYPDAQADAARQAVAALEGVGAEEIVFGNGASELFLALVHALAPKKIAIPVPSFFGYEHAARASGGEVRYLTALDQLEGDTDLLFLANPNNPTGTRMERGQLRRVLEFCREKEIYVALDECFMDFCEEDSSMLREREEFPNLMILRAFTKIFAIPGVRLGYLICAAEPLREKIQRHLPEWNLSCFAQRAAVACGESGAFRRESAAYVGAARRGLREQLEALGLEVLGESRANFLLVRAETELYAPLLEKGILIRDCRNFRGLGAGYYRLAVKTPEENRRLVEALRDILG